MGFFLIIIVFGLLTELVLHRWLRLYSHDIAGAALLFFGGYWILASVRRLYPTASIGDRLAPQPLNRTVEAYVATLPGIAIKSFVGIAGVGVLERLWQM